MLGLSGTVVRVFLLSQLLSASGASQLISSSKSRLPMSLSSVINDLEAEGASTITRACLVTSRGVTLAQRAAVLQSIFGLEETETEFTAFGTKADEADNGLAIAIPTSQAPVSDVASTVVACGGTVIYAPSAIDLTRGEGLFDTLAPAIERLVATGTKSSLIVIASDAEAARQQLQQAASAVLPNLMQPRGKRPVQVLEDVFTTVDYVTAPTDVAAKLATVQGCEPSEAASAIAATVDFFAPPAEMPTLANKDLAAARKLGPRARVALESALETVKRTIADTPLITNFGDLCDVAVKRAMQELEAADMISPVAQQIKTLLREELYAEMSDLYGGQMSQLQTAAFESFRKNLSQLRVSPNLADDMDRVVQESLVDFSKAAKKLIAAGAKTWSSVPATTSFANKLKDFCAERLLVAKASGQYKPAPRKGVTIGLHWLLPKPFGNDFRQEPWMVHATDNMVYVPQDKITNVAPEDIKTGDWRSKVVPSPSAREMVYIQ